MQHNFSKSHSLSKTSPYYCVWSFYNFVDTIKTLICGSQNTSAAIINIQSELSESQSRRGVILRSYRSWNYHEKVLKKMTLHYFQVALIEPDLGLLPEICSTFSAYCHKFRFHILEYARYHYKLWNRIVWVLKCSMRYSAIIPLIKIACQILRKSDANENNWILKIWKNWNFQFSN